MLSYNPFYNPQNNIACKNPSVYNIWEGHKISTHKTEIPAMRKKIIEHNPSPAPLQQLRISNLVLWSL